MKPNPHHNSVCHLTNTNPTNRQGAGGDHIRSSAHSWYRAFRLALLLGLAVIVACERPSDHNIPEANPLVGQPAPSIEAQLLDGSPFNLAEQHAKKVVLLDFWATWCPPCLIELPVLQKIADEFKDKGVVLYTVNCGEDSETVERFLKDREWQFNVILDPDGRHAVAYDVNALPQLVVIGRDGKVHRLHVGFSNKLEDELRSELNSLLAG